MGTRTRLEILLLATVAILVAVIAALWHRGHPLPVALSAEQRQFIAGDPDAGLTASARVEQPAVQHLADTTDPTLIPFEREHHAHAVGVTDGRFTEKHTDTGPPAAVTGLPPPTCVPVASSAADMPVHYSAHDRWNRFTVDDLDIRHSAPVWTVTQHFHLAGIVLADAAGLQTESLRLMETTGDGVKIADVPMDSAEFHYSVTAPAESLWEPHLTAVLLTTFRREAPIAGGVGALLLHWKQFNLGVAAYTDAKSLAGTGATAQIVWRPQIGVSRMNAGLTFGVAVALDAAVHPSLGLVFVIL